MERRQTSLIWGIGLLVVGALLLLRNLDVIPDTGEFLPAVLFIVGGAVFGWLYISNRDQWWWIIPSGALLGIGLLIGLTGLSRAAGGRWGGSIFLACLAASFLVVFATHRDLWWALIPGGVLLTTAIVAGLPSDAGELSGAVMMFGMAATFALVALLDAGQQRFRWALIPAGILGVLGVVILLEAATWSNIVIAIVMVAAGLFLIYRGIRSHTEE